MTRTDDDDATVQTDTVSGCTPDGAVLDDVDVLELLRAEGLLRIVRGPAHRLRRSGWADQFSDYACRAGMHVRISEVGRLVLIVDIRLARQGTRAGGGRPSRPGSVARSAPERRPTSAHRADAALTAFGRR